MKNGLTIAIPVFNEEHFIERAIRCTAPQCEQVIVSDNASTDRTGEICRDLLDELPNVKYIRQDVNIGSFGNCMSILQKVTTPYVMYMGSHDLIDENYASTVLPAIAGDDSIAVATGELCLEYGSRTEEVDSYNAWTGGLEHDPKTRVLSFLFDRAPLEWASYGIFRTESVRDFLTEDLPAYGVDIIFLARILKQGRLSIRKGACYHAWVREDKGPKSSYLERVTAKKHAYGASKQLRNAFRVAQYRMITDFFPTAGFWKRLALRHRAMVRFGTFRHQGLDILYYLLYLPVKIVRKFDRTSRLIK